MIYPARIRRHITIGTPLVLLAFALITVQGCAQTEPIPEIVESTLPSERPSRSKRTVEYKIEEKIVSSEEYQYFMLGLKEVEGTYHCAKTVTGGRNSYDATDAVGVLWTVHNVVTKEENLSWITKKSEK